MSRLRSSWLMQAFMALVWCSFVAARPAVLACPTGGHGSAHSMSDHASMSQGDDAASAHAGHETGHETGVHADQATHAGHSSPADDQREQAPPPHLCDCLGHCCAIAAIPQQPTAAVLRVVERVGQAPLPEEHPTLATRWVDFVLPFAIAPPVSVRS